MKNLLHVIEAVCALWEAGIMQSIVNHSHWLQHYTYTVCGVLYGSNLVVEDIGHLR